MRILIIDDDTVVREMICEMLNEESYETFEAANGKEGMKLLRSTPDIDLVIIDIIMPEKDGIETIIEIKKDFSYIRTIAISGGGRGTAEFYLASAKSLGADLAIGKPFVKQELVESIQELFEGK